MSGNDNISWTTVSVTADYTVLDTDYVILADPTSGDITATLPAAGGSGTPAGRIYIFRTTGTTNDLIIATADSADIDGSSTKTLSSGSVSAAQVVTDGTDWFTVN